MAKSSAADVQGMRADMPFKPGRPLIAQLLLLRCPADYAHSIPTPLSGCCDWSGALSAVEEGAVLACGRLWAASSARNLLSFSVLRLTLISLTSWPSKTMWK